MATYLKTTHIAAEAPVVHVYTLWYMGEYKNHVLYGIYSDSNQAFAERDRLESLSHIEDAWVRLVEVIQPSEEL